MVDLVNDQKPTVPAAAGLTMVASALAAYEFIYGAIISRRPRVHVPNAERLRAELEIVPGAHQDGLAAARVRHALRRAGGPSERPTH